MEVGNYLDTEWKNLINTEYQADSRPTRRQLDSPSNPQKKKKKRHKITSLWLFLWRIQGYTLSFCGTLWSEDALTPEAILKNRYSKMAVRAAIRSVCGLLWQVPGDWGRKAGRRGQLPPSLAVSCRSARQEPSAIVFCTSARLLESGKKGAGFMSNCFTK